MSVSTLQHRLSAVAHTRRGVVVPLLALLLPVLMILLGFSVDVAHMQKTRAELRLATDSAARVAASTLATTDSVTAARAAAKRIALANSVDGKGLSLEDAQIVFGRSHEVGERYVFSAGGTPPNAVRVEGRRTSASADGAVALYFGPMVGQADFEPEFDAVASFVNTDICLVLDRSTSMKLSASTTEIGMMTDDPRFCAAPYADSRWGALDNAVRGFTAFLERTNSIERVAVATYASDITGDAVYGACGTYRTTQAATLDRSLTESMASVDATMGDLSGALWNGNTFIEAGMRAGMAELLGNGRHTAELKMIVMTDGHQNAGDAVAAARDCAANGIEVHAVTLGDFAGQAVMADVADTGGGKYLHAPDAASLEAAFQTLAGVLTRLTE